MQSCIASSVDVVKNVINKVTRSRVQSRAAVALALPIQEHIASLCHKRVPVCLDVFITCSCTSATQGLFYTSPSKTDGDYHKSSSACDSIHVERWTCTFLNRRSTEGSVSDYDLLTGIGDCIQKSQFSSWFRSHKSNKTYSIHYRLGAPDEVSDMSTTDVSFAQVFPVVYLDRNTCLQTAMASFFDANSSLLIGCKMCGIPGSSYIQSRLLSFGNDINTTADTHTVGSPSQELLPGFSKLEQMDTSQKSSLTDASAAGAFIATPRSGCSSRSESPACLLPFSSLAFPSISGSAAKDERRLPTVMFGCGVSSLQPRPLGEADLQAFLTEVKQNPLDESLTVLEDGYTSPEKLSFSSTVQNTMKQIPDEERCSPEPASAGVMRPNCPVRVRSLPASRPSPLAVDCNLNQVTASEPVANTGRSFPTAISSARYFNPLTGLPLHSSPAPLKRGGVRHFSFDPQLTSPRRIRSSVSGCELVARDERFTFESRISSLAPSSPLLGTFEESLLNGRIMPVGAVDGFKADLAASGAFCSPHVTFPVGAYFFQLDEAAAPWASPYLGVVNLRQLGVMSSLPIRAPSENPTPKTRSRYYIPPRGTVQVTLFNPNRTVLKMFVVLYDLSDMPPSSTTFIRQRTLYMPVINSEAAAPSSAVSNNSSVASHTSQADKTGCGANASSSGPSFLRYVIHLRVATSCRGRLFLHSDVRLIFASDRFEFDSRVAAYEMRSFTEQPSNPKYSPRR